MPMIGVLVPVYNVEAYLPRFIESVLAQSYQDFELLLVNDGSTDKSGEICDTYAATDPRVRVIHQENQGVACTRNKMLDWAFQSDCRWIAFLDSDDSIADIYLERLMDNAVRHVVDISVCAAAVTHSTQPILKDVPEIPAEAVVISGAKACEEVYKINGMTTVACWGKLILKSLFEGIRFPEGKIHEDEAIIPQVMYRAERIAITTEPLYFYYQSDNSIMRSTFHVKRFQALEAMDTCIRFFAEKGEQDIVNTAIKRRTVMHSLSILLAKQHGILHQVPDMYRISPFRALCQMHRCTTYDEFTWHLTKFYPRLVKPYSYARKIYTMIAGK